MSQLNTAMNSSKASATDYTPINLQLNMLTQVRLTNILIILALILALLLLMPNHAKAGTPAQAQDKGYLYWAIVDHDESIWRSELNNLSQQLVTGRSSTRQIAFDSINNKIYWLNGNVNGSIRRSNLDGSQQQTLIQFNNEEVMGLALDVAAGKMYWLDETSLNRANMDGSNSEVLNNSLTGTLDIEIDVANSHLYYRAGGIMRSDLDGNNIVEILPANGNTTFNDMELDLINGKIYYSDANHALGLRRVDFDGQNIEILINNTNLSNIYITNSQLFYVKSNSNSQINVANLDTSNEQVYLTNVLGERIDSFIVDINLGNVYMVLIPKNQLINTDLSGNSPIGLMAALGDLLHDVAVNPNGKQLFIADQSANHVKTTNYEGLNASVAIVDSATIGEIRGLKFDPINNQIYWVDANNSSNGGIKRMDIDGSNFTQLVSGINKPHDITLDISGDKMYWTENIGGGTSLTASIRSANLDGSNPVDVMTGLSQGIRGIDFDSVNNRLYFTDQSSNLIQRIDTDGTNLETVTTSIKPHDVAIDNNTGTLYWTEGIDNSSTTLSGVIRSADLDGGNVTDVFSGLPSVLRDISVVYVCQTAQPLLVITPAIDSGFPGDTLTYTVTITNLNSPSCDDETFDLSFDIPLDFTAILADSSITLASGASQMTSIAVTSDVASPFVTQNTITVIVTPQSTASNTSINAIYTVIDPNFLLTVSTSGTGSGTITAVGIDCGADCDEIYNVNTQVSLTATAATGSGFVSWSGGNGACSGSNATIQITITDDLSCDAEFSLNSYTLDITIVGQGSVISTPTGIDCGVDCDEIYDFNTQVSLTATAATGSGFVSWSGGNGACSGSNATIQITITDDLSCDAEFSLNSYTLDIIIVGQGSVISTPAGIDCGVDCSQVAVFGSVFSLQTNPNQGYLFDTWSGDTDCLDAEVTMTEDLNCIATFVVDPDVIFINGFDEVL